ncbi:hypothetical protein CN213_06015 [Sinorhizobium meliloti]|uniref:hypothetical protein n=1 Tax=Rhizobium meliloti TaxID=382 RepID=UPI000FDC6401|nr:hypothetical protein [Sinorhizobium meliloti]RVH60061.1 hypothetical protein CN213_06015 [Sinorhizobium meliloti]
MRGRKSGHRCALHSPVASASAANGPRILTDIVETFPVSAAELDAIESFLGTLILCLIDGELPAIDSEAPHIQATTKERVTREERRGEVFVEDLV